MLAIAALTQSVVYVAANNSYSMYISNNAGKTISWNYKIEAKQGSTPESTGYIVVEHQPESCAMFPANGNITFTSIVVEVEGEVVTNPDWVVAEETPACESKAVVVDAETVMLQWSAAPQVHKPSAVITRAILTGVLVITETRPSFERP